MINFDRDYIELNKQIKPDKEFIEKLKKNVKYELNKKSKISFIKFDSMFLKVASVIIVIGVVSIATYLNINNQENNQIAKDEKESVQGNKTEYSDGIERVVVKDPYANYITIGDYEYVFSLSSYADDYQKNYENIELDKLIRIIKVEESSAFFQTGDKIYTVKGVELNDYLILVHTTEDGTEYKAKLLASNYKADKDISMREVLEQYDKDLKVDYMMMENPYNGEYQETSEDDVNIILNNIDNFTKLEPIETKFDIDMLNDNANIKIVFDNNRSVYLLYQRENLNIEPNGVLSGHQENISCDGHYYNIPPEVKEIIEKNLNQYKIEYENSDRYKERQRIWAETDNR